MPVPFVDLAAIHDPIIGEINGAIAGVLSRNQYLLNNDVERFEEAFAQYIGRDYAVGCANGTDALELAIEVLDLGPEDEVIVPVHSWISTASAVIRAGAKVVFADTLYDEYTIDPADLERAITPRTKAIIAVHLYGHPCRMDAILSIAQKYKLVVIEDCAQAHGAMYQGKKVGSFGLMSCFSFYPSKNIGALGDAGAVLTDDKDLTDRIRAIANCGQIKKNSIAYIGRNSRMDAMQAAVLNVKLRYLDEWNESRREMASFYGEILNPDDFELPVEAKDSRHVYHLYVVKTKHRQDWIKKLDRHQIGWAIHYPYLMNQVDGLKDGKTHKNAYQYQDRILSLPMYPGMGIENMESLKSLFSDISINVK